MDSETVLGLLKKNGCRGVIVPYYRVEEARDEIRALRRDATMVGERRTVKLTAEQVRRGADLSIHSFRACDRTCLLPS